jgi:hypothetical protein
MVQGLYMAQKQALMIMRGIEHRTFATGAGGGGLVGSGDAVLTVLVFCNRAIGPGAFAPTWTHLLSPTL